MFWSSNSIKPDYASVDDLDRICTLFEKGTSIKHPNVVKYGNVADDNGLVFTQEYVPSTNLREWIPEQTSQWREDIP